MTEDLTPNWERMLGQPGSVPITYQRTLLKEKIPQELQDWVDKGFGPRFGCVIVGTKRGKTWLASWAAHEYMARNPDKFCARWKEQDYINNRTHLGTVEKIMTKMPYDDTVWTTYFDYERDFYRLLNAPFLVFDNYGYTTKPPWVDDDVTMNLLHYRDEQNLNTLVVARELSDDESVVRDLFWHKYLTIPFQ